MTMVKPISHIFDSFMLQFQIKYFIFTVVLFTVEVLIALYVNDNFIRPYAGDFLVVILLYCFFKTFLNTSVLAIAVPVLLFAYAIETAQYFELSKHLPIQNHHLLRIILGSSFEWRDMLAYTLGIVPVLFLEKQKPAISPGTRL
ncbi:MAG TPA: DUF2809 domain-containing protein [Flavisolibacter sp.]|jgi:hypothetical protein|nr:DUF2809 domain-containing protein [Flavisolibacter sp.]